MSLSKAVIYGSDDDVAKALSYREDLNQLDEYGYTPLIQAAIVNSVSKARLLLARGAKLNFPDLTGRAALHWAADNNNLELCKLLLDQGADANVYTYAGQPALVIPILRKRNRKVKRLLLSRGADLEFAQDFINAKLLGHRFELEGRCDIVDHKNTFIEIELEGFYSEFSLDIVVNSLEDFRRNFAGKHLRKYFSKLDLIVKALKGAGELVRYRHYLVDVDQYEKRISQFLSAEPLILPISVDGHATTIIKFYDLIVRCDRGAFGRKNGSVIFYEMHNPAALTKSACKRLLYQRQSREFIDNGLEQYLGLEARYRMSLSLQRVGNCAWANIEAVIPALMFLFLLKEQGLRKVTECSNEALNFFNEWEEWDKSRSLYFCFKSFKETTPARKAAKAALLASILFQACAYDRDEDQEKAQKILSILTIPEYDYILNCYFNVFGHDRRDQKMVNLRNFLDDYRTRIE